jgi:hypothetical protein
MVTLCASSLPVLAQLPRLQRFVYRLVIEYEPRGGIAGFFDRVLLKRGIRRAFERTFVALEQQLIAGQPA